MHINVLHTFNNKEVFIYLYSEHSHGQRVYYIIVEELLKPSVLSTYIIYNTLISERRLYKGVIIFKTIVINFIKYLLVVS